MKRITSLFLTVLLIVLSSSFAFAETNTSDLFSNPIQIEFEIPVDADGISNQNLGSLVIYSDGTYDIMSKVEANQIVESPQVNQAKVVVYTCNLFVDLYFNGSFSEISWEAVCSHSIMTQATGSILLKSTSAIFPEYYFEKDDISVKGSNGTAKVLAGSYSCSLPKGISKVKGEFTFTVSTNKTGQSFKWKNVDITFSK